MKQLILVVAVLGAVLTLAAGQSTECPFNPVDACNRGDFGLRNVHYVRDGCNCSAFWQCERVRGQIMVYPRECPPCSCFNDATWVCSDFQNLLPGQVCPIESPVNETITIIADSCFRTGNGPAGNYTQQYKVIKDDLTSFIWVVSGDDVVMKCPPGTAFDFSNKCQCVACQPGQQCATDNTRVFRMNFDNVTELQGVYVDTSASLTVVPGGIVGFGELFDGTGDIAIPSFKNNEFCDFTFSLWFQRNASSTAGEQGLISNGNNKASDCASTIQILSTDTTVSATIITTNATATITHTSTAPHGLFHHVVLRYNCTQLDLFVDGIVQSTTISGTTLRTKCSLLIGQSVDIDDRSHYFNGIVDEHINTVVVVSANTPTVNGSYRQLSYRQTDEKVRFYRKAVSDVDVSRLLSSPGSNP